MTAKRALFLQHDHVSPPGPIAERFAQRGFEIHERVVVQPDQFHAPNVPYDFPPPRDYDVLVVMGAPWGAWDDDAIGQWLLPELDWIRDARVLDVPVLGICFGGQLLARAHGGSVARATKAEIGWTSIWSQEPDLVSAGPWFQWHYDRWQLPPDAREIARNSVASQAFVLWTQSRSSVPSRADGCGVTGLAGQRRTGSRAGRRPGSGGALRAHGCRKPHRCRAGARPGRRLPGSGRLPVTLSLGDDRDAALEHAAELVAKAWREFDQARDDEAPPSESLLNALREHLPEQPGNVITNLDLAVDVLDASLAQSRPRFLAFIGSSGLEVGALADLLAHSYDINLAIDARAATLLEAQTIGWLAEFLGFPAASGSFTSGGTISNITALAAARERALPGSRSTGMRDQRAALYCSAEAHYSLTRAGELLGIGSDNVRAIGVDDHRRMRADLLADAIDADVATGVTPIAVMATAGTTLTGAVDPIEAISDVCETRGTWLHVDGAYGLPAAAAPSTAGLFGSLARADSVSVDAHKWMFVPKACSAVLVRSTAALAAAFSHDEAYMPHDDHALNAVDVTLEYSRPFRALKLWLALRVHGAQAFRDAIEANLAQANLLYDLASADPEFQVRPFPPQLSITPLRHVQRGDVDIDAHNDALCRAMQRDGRVYISPAIIDGETWLRPCFTNFRTTEEDVRVTLDVAREIGNAI